MKTFPKLSGPKSQNSFSLQEFVLLAKELLTLTDLRMRLVKNAKGYVDKHHSILQERDTYSALVSNLNS